MNQEDFITNGGKVLERYQGTGGNVIIPEGVTWISHEAFEGKEELITEIYLPDSLEGIYTDNFNRFVNLQSVRFSETLGSIPSGGFQGTALKEVHLPPSVKCVGWNAFADCKNLIKVTMGSSVEIGNQAFHGTPFLEKLRQGDYTIYGDGYLLDYHGDYIVTRGEDTFHNAVEIPEGVTAIAGGLFYEKNLEFLRLPSTLKQIGDQAFTANPLEGLEIPESVEVIGREAFKHCYNLKNVKFSPNSKLKALRHGAFAYCSGIRGELNLPPSLEKIGESAFLSCWGLRKLTIPSSLKKIKNYVFEDCYGIQTLILQEGIEEIHSNAFNGCTSLGELKFPESLTHLGYRAFSGCTSLSFVVLPNNIEHLDRDAFHNCHPFLKLSVGIPLTGIQQQTINPQKMISELEK